MLKMPSLADIGVVLAVLGAFQVGLETLTTTEWYWVPIASTITLALIKGVQVLYEQRKLAQQQAQLPPGAAAQAQWTPGARSPLKRWAID